MCCRTQYNFLSGGKKEAITSFGASTLFLSYCANENLAQPAMAFLGPKQHIVTVLQERLDSFLFSTRSFSLVAKILRISFRQSSQMHKKIMSVKRILIYDERVADATCK